MNSFYEHHKDSIRWQYRCFDRLLLNALIQPFQQPERVVGFFNSYRQLYPVGRNTLCGIAEQFQQWLKGWTEKREVPVLDAPNGRRDDFVDAYFKGASPDEVVAARPGQGMWPNGGHGHGHGPRRRNIRRRKVLMWPSGWPRSWPPCFVADSPSMIPAPGGWFRVSPGGRSGGSPSFTARPCLLTVTYYTIGTSGLASKNVINLGHSWRPGGGNLPAARPGPAPGWWVVPSAAGCCRYRCCPPRPTNRPVSPASCKVSRFVQKSEARVALHPHEAGLSLHCPANLMRGRLKGREKPAEAASWRHSEPPTSARIIGGESATKQAGQARGHPLGHIKTLRRLMFCQRGLWPWP
jgi:hypothetical protein